MIVLRLLMNLPGLGVRGVVVVTGVADPRLGVSRTAGRHAQHGRSHGAPHGEHAGEQDQEQDAQQFHGPQTNRAEVS